MDEHKIKKEIQNNLGDRGWQVKDIPELKDTCQVLHATKRFLLFIKRTHIYVVIEQITENKIRYIRERLQVLNYNYHGIWFASKEISDDALKYARKEDKVGLIELK